MHLFSLFTVCCARDTTQVLVSTQNTRRDAAPVGRIVSQVHVLRTEVSGEASLCGRRSQAPCLFSASPCLRGRSERQCFSMTWTSAHSWRSSRSFCEGEAHSGISTCPTQATRFYGVERSVSLSGLATESGLVSIPHKHGRMCLRNVRSQQKHAETRRSIVAPL